jgi:CxxC motif-containing protein (DUF1111 family)
MCQSRGAFWNGAWYLDTSRLGRSGLGSRIRWGGVAIVLLVVGCFSPAGARGDDQPVSAEQVKQQITAGRELFAHEWKVADPLSAPGDGLGPMYNAVSCAKCHRLGGMGGAGANDENVDLLTLKVPRNVSVVDDDLRRRIAAFHPALAIGPVSTTTVLHRFSPDASYDAWRGRFLAASRQAQLPFAGIVAFATGATKHPLKGINPIQRLDGMAYQHSQRNTPALFGAGAIDRLPDSVFKEMQHRQAAKAGGVSGRAPRAANGHVGRFGWRGQTENLHEFVLGACAIELGLEAPGRSQPIDPLRVRFDRPVSLGRDGLDISDEQCQSLTQFVAHLPPPRRLTPTDSGEAEMAAQGEKQFEKIGCADCHARQVAEISGIYSDLLLHDLGEGLADPVPANPAQGSVGSASYYGGGDSLLVKVPPELRREWRTPPLWGVRDSAPYLHDGRAPTFSEAIAWHGGEAAGSARDFRQLEQDEQEEVLAFLNCLTAPMPD